MANLLLTPSELIIIMVVLLYFLTLVSNYFLGYTFCCQGEWTSKWSTSHILPLFIFLLYVPRTSSKHPLFGACTHIHMNICSHTYAQRHTEACAHTQEFPVVHTLVTTSSQHNQHLFLCRPLYNSFSSHSSKPTKSINLPLSFDCSQDVFDALWQETSALSSS